MVMNAPKYLICWCDSSGMATGRKYMYFCDQTGNIYDNTQGHGYVVFHTYYPDSYVSPLGISLDSMLYIAYIEDIFRDSASILDLL